MASNRLLIPLALAASAMALPALAQGPGPSGGGGETRAAVSPRTAELPPETVLADNGVVRVTKADLDLEMLKLPENVRGGFFNQAGRVRDLVNRLMVTKMMAIEADKAGLDREPATAAKIRAEVDRAKAQAYAASIEADAAARFENQRSAFESRAREVYTIDPGKWGAPEQVAVSHILFSTDKHTRDEAMELARVARARIAGGEDFNVLAGEISEDPTAKQNRGKIGLFQRGVMDSLFSAAAFKLAKVGDISQPVVTPFGVHLIRLDERKVATRPPFEQVRDRIMADLRQKYINDQRDEVLGKLRDQATAAARDDAIESMVIHVDSSVLEQIQRDLPKRK